LQANEAAGSYPNGRDGVDGGNQRLQRLSS
jgi:hypothetical protein